MSPQSLVIVEDEAAMRSYLIEVLAQNGYNCMAFEDGRAAVRYLASPEADPVDLVLSDIGMPGMSGLELLRVVKTLAPTLPVILLSGLYNLATAVDACRRGAADYLLKPATPEEILKLLRKHLQTNEPDRKEAVKAALIQLLEARRLSGSATSGYLDPLFDVLGFKSFETLQHSQRVSAYAVLLGSRFGLDGETLSVLELGAQLHDIGKIAIPHNVLMKPGPLNDHERSVMQLHPEIGRELLASVPGIGEEIDIVFCHHERFDGQGYPSKLAGEAIPVGARIFSVVDTIDAITADRPYRAGRDYTVARQEVERMRGTQFDPAIVDCLRGIADAELHEIRRKYKDK